MTPKEKTLKRIERINRMVALHSEGKTYEEIGKEYGISRQRVEQIINGTERRSRKATESFCQDITFCSNKECKFEKCKRNACHIRWDIKPYQSFADFENTKYCPKTKE